MAVDVTNTSVHILDVFVAELGFQPPELIVDDADVVDRLTVAWQVVVRATLLPVADLAVDSGLPAEAVRFALGHRSCPARRAAWPASSVWPMR